jgi:hypothetical protein
MLIQIQNSGKKLQAQQQAGIQVNILVTTVLRAKKLLIS